MFEQILLNYGKLDQNSWNYVELEEKSQNDFRFFQIIGFHLIINLIN